MSVEQFEYDFEQLGIDVKFYMLEPDNMGIPRCSIIFDTQEDLTLYRLLGQLKEGYSMILGGVIEFMVKA